MNACNTVDIYMVEYDKADFEIDKWKLTVLLSSK